MERNEHENEIRNEKRRSGKNLNEDKDNITTTKQKIKNRSIGTPEKKKKC